MRSRALSSVGPGRGDEGEELQDAAGSAPPPGLRTAESGARRQPAWVLLCAAGTIAIAAAGRTTRQTCTVMEAWQRNECSRIVEPTEHERCLDG